MELTRTGGRGDGGVDMVGVWTLPDLVGRGIGDGGGGVVRTAGTTGTGSDGSGGSSGTSTSTTHGTAASNAPPSTSPTAISSFLATSPPTSSPLTASLPLKVLIQCKRFTSKSKVTPALIRELEGALRNGPPGWRDQSSVMGILVATKPATKGLRDAMRGAKQAVCWVCLDIDEGEEEGEVEGNGGATEGGNSAEITMGDDEEESKAIMPHYTVRQILWNRAADELGLLGLDATVQHQNRQSDGGKGSSRVVLSRNGVVVAG